MLGLQEWILMEEFIFVMLCIFEGYVFGYLWVILTEDFSDEGFIIKFLKIWFWK